MSKLARTLALVAMLAAMAVTGMTAAAQAHVADQAVRQDARRPPTRERPGEYWRHRPAPAADHLTPDDRVRLLLARERFSYPSDAPAQATSPIRPAEHSGRAGWLAPALTGLALVVALIAGVTVSSTRRANRVQRAGQTA
jgi:hypothetical protein